MITSDPMASRAPTSSPTDDAAARPSKTQQKKDAHDRQQLGEALAGLADDRLEALALPESLREALHEYRRTRSHEGRRRQLQYVGKLMRGVDAEPIRAAIAASRIGSARDTLALHRAERWRDELLADDAALTRWAEHHAGSDLQRLRSLVRGARQDESADAAPGAAARRGRAYRELFQFIRQHDDDRDE